MKVFPFAVCTSLAFLEAAANANYDIPQARLLEEVPPLFCPEDALVCANGTVLVRDPNNNCEFPSCTDDEDAEDVIKNEEKDCSSNFKVCTDGMIRYGDPLNNCKIPSCPIEIENIPCGWLKFNGELMCYDYGRNLPEGANPWLDNGCNMDASGRSVHSRIFCGANSNGDCEKTLVEEPCVVNNEELMESEDEDDETSRLSGAFDGHGKSVGLQSILTAGATWFLMAK